MKHNNNIGWLTFLMLPLVVLLILHFLIPLSFVVESYPTARDQLLKSKIHQQRTSIRSLSYVAQKQVTKYIQGIISIDQAIISLFSQLNTHSVRINTENVQINNGFNYSKYIESRQGNLNLTQSQSMWFATGVDQTQNLSPGQQQLLQRYKNIEPFVPSLFTDPQLMHSLAFYLVSNSSDSLYVEYPSRISEKCSNLSNPVIDSVYTATVALADGETAPFLENSADGSRLLSLCTPSQLNSLTVVSCLRLNLFTLGTNLFSFFENQRFSNYFQGYFFLSTSPQISLFQPLVGIMFKSNNGSKELQLPQNQTLSNLNQLQPVFVSTPTALSSEIYVFQSNFSLFTVVPIQLSAMIPLRILLSCKIRQTTDVEGVISELVRDLLVPIIIIIFLSVVLSIIILKCLLSSVDKELCDLDSRSSFIVKGDIKVQIPEHKGTQDIREVYNVARIINKLHLYSTQSYFSGHFADKALKYEEAKQFLMSLNYDISNVLQNLGEVETWLEEWDKARDHLKQSVHLIQNQIKSEFESFQQMYLKKIKRQGKIPLRYLMLEVILIRRLFKLNFFYFRYLQLKQIFLKKQVDEQDKQKFLQKQEQIAKQSKKYIDMQKKAFFPDESTYSQCIVCYLNECKQAANLKDIDGAEILLKKTQKLINRYSAKFDQTTQKLKIKDSKYKLLRLKNKITLHSRIEPDILLTFMNMFKAKIFQAKDKSPNKYNKALEVLLAGMKVGYFTAAITYLSALELRKILKELNIRTESFETTQIFRQSCPLYSLHYGQLTKQVEPSLLKMPTKVTPGLEREFVFIFDCGTDKSKQINSDLLEYQSERISYLFKQRIKNTDRISIIKYGTKKQGLKVQCSLLLKESNQVILKETLDNCLFERNQRTKKKSVQVCMIEALKRSIWRVKNLKLQKVVIMFFRQLSEYQLFNKHQKRSTKSDNQKEYQWNSEEEQSFCSGSTYSDLGKYVIQFLQEEDLRNLKLILYCSNQDSSEDFIKFFGLKDVNRRIWAKTGGINRWNNVVYIINKKHKADIDRILMLKCQIIADNNIFIL